jgi:hypothetical protein
MEHIKYRGTYSGGRDWAGETSLYDTPEEAVEAAIKCLFPNENGHASYNAEYVGPLDAPMRAVEDLKYQTYPSAEWRTIPAGEVFTPGSLITRWRSDMQTVGHWLLHGKAGVVAQEQQPAGIGAQGTEVLEQTSES